jgi:hypothetical protein
MSSTTIKGGAVTKAVIVVRSLDVDYGKSGGERTNQQIRFGLDSCLVQICDELGSDGVTHILLVGIEKQDVVGDLADQFPGIQFEYRDLHLAYASLAFTLNPVRKLGELNLRDDFSIVICDAYDVTSMSISVHLIGHESDLTLKERWVSEIAFHYRSEEHLVEMLRAARSRSYNIAAFIPNDGGAWRTLMQYASREYQMNIGVYAYDRDAILKAFLDTL